MPLEHAAVGSPGFGRNIAAEVKAGRPKAQAVAIAYKEAGEDDGFDMLGDALAGMAGDESEEDREGEKNEPQIHDSAGIVFVAPNGRVLFLRRDALASHGGDWDWPGGHLKPGETLLEGAIRESHEECGYLAPAEKVREMNRAITEDMDFTTFICPVPEMFKPDISRDEFGHREHDDWRWADPRDPPEPLHPGIEDVLSNPMIEEIIKKGDVDPEEAEAVAEDAKWDALVAAMDEMRLEDRLVLALDKASLREYDSVGRMKVALTPISKSNVCPYVGKEIPRYKELGLSATRIYRLLRDPDELAKSASTFNMIPVLEVHVPTSAEDHPQEVTVGCTGTDAIFEFPYLMNSMALWMNDAIDDVESEYKRELSSSYEYDVDLTPGVFNGEPYDGRMINIKGNHVALVRAGRAGGDVLVLDSFDDELKWALVEEALRGVAA